MRTNLPVTNIEHELDESDFLISRTTTKGVITYANEAFVKMSRYSESELIGQAHNILRHPDMPQAAFKNMWDTIQKGEIWNGIVKNRSKDGAFYWVKANVTPQYAGNSLIGYTSVRVKPSKEEVRQAESMYALINQGKSIPYRLDRGQFKEKGLKAFISKATSASVDGFIIRSTFVSSFALMVSAVLAYFGDAADHNWFFIAQIATAAAGISLMSFFNYLASRSIQRSIDGAIEYAAQIAAGSLMSKRPVTPDPQIDRIAEMIDANKKSLVYISAGIRRAMTDFVETSQDIAHGNDDLARRTDSQAASLQETAASMEELTATVQQNSSNAMHASKLSEEAASSVRSTGTVMSEVVQTMNSIITDSREMSQKIEVIDSIAFQTNILALNASVEAARAGEQGRGFAVVAQEVRSLAQRSAEAARDIGELISRSSKQINSGERLVKRAEESIDEVISAVSKVNDIMGEISAASGEQSLGISQVNVAMAQMDEVTSKNAVLVQSVTNASKSLLEKTDGLAQAIRVFEYDETDAKPLRQKSRKTVEKKTATEASSGKGSSPRPASEFDNEKPGTNLKRPDLSGKTASESQEWESF